MAGKIAETINKTIEPINKIPLVVKIIIFTVVIAGMIAGFYFLSYVDKEAKIQEISKDIKGLQAKLIEAQTRSRELARFEKELREAEIDFARMRQLLPKTEEIPAFLEKLEQLANDTGLEVLLFRPSPKELQQDFYAVKDIDIMVLGKYDRVAMFFYRLSQQDRIVNVNRVEMSGYEEATGKLRTSCVATIYRYTGKPKPVEARPGKKAK
ncbi:MAG: type 4a pilus biogenesis protein PilO [Deltaproteobacteria bacterium]|nr:type 4a pilus biogenesis protein PilO [Deltaproteobacteria bacterium]